MCVLTVCCLSEHCIARSIRVIIIIIIIKGPDILKWRSMQCESYFSEFALIPCFQTETEKQKDTYPLKP